MTLKVICGLPNCFQANRITVNTSKERGVIRRLDRGGLTLAGSRKSQIISTQKDPTSIFCKICCGRRHSVSEPFYQA